MSWLSLKSGPKLHPEKMANGAWGPGMIDTKGMTGGKSGADVIRRTRSSGRGQDRSCRSIRLTLKWWRYPEAPSPGGSASSTEDSGPSLPTALEEQLGLNESGRARWSLWSSTTSSAPRRISHSRFCFSFCHSRRESAVVPVIRTEVVRFAPPKMAALGCSRCFTASESRALLLAERVACGRFSRPAPLPQPRSAAALLI